MNAAAGFPFTQYELSAVVTRADGTVEDLGVIASTDTSNPASSISDASPSEKTMSEETQTLAATDVGASLAAEVTAAVPTAQQLKLDELKASRNKVDAEIRVAEQTATLANSFATATTDLDHDDALLRSAGGLMEARLAEMRAKGATGWLTSSEDLAAKAREQIESGRLLDGAIYALMALVQKSLAA